MPIVGPNPFEPVPDNEQLPVHYRWTLGAATAIATGWSTDANGSSVQIVVGETSCQFLRFDFVVQPGGTAPTGAALVVDVQVSHNGGGAGGTWTSFFANEGQMPTLPPGTLCLSVAANAPCFVNKGDFLRAYVQQVGSNNAGENILFTATGWALCD